MYRFFWGTAAVLGGTAVAMGAFAAHLLQGTPAGWVETAARYQMYHALALFGVGIVVWLSPAPPRALAIAGWTWILGVLGFSGGLYGLALLHWRALAWVTPLGGLLLLVGWVSLLVAVGQGVSLRPDD